MIDDTTRAKIRARLETVHFTAPNLGMLVQLDTAIAICSEFVAEAVEAERAKIRQHFIARHKIDCGYLDDLEQEPLC
jgi:hypothetical protein